MKKIYHTISNFTTGLVWMMATMVFNSCSSSYQNLTPVTNADPGCVMKFKPTFTRTLYNTQVDILKTHLSGILFIKQMPDSSTRLVFSTETGFKFFDFEFSREGAFTVHYILDKMNRKPVINTLENDFSLLLMNRMQQSSGSFKKDDKLYHRFSIGNGKYNSYYITDTLCTLLKGAENRSGRKASSRLMYSGFSQNEPDSVYISHAGIKFIIALKRLEAVENNN